MSIQLCAHIQFFSFEMLLLLATYTYVGKCVYMLVPMVYPQRHVIVQELKTTSSNTYIHISVYVSTLTVMLLTYVRMNLPTRRTLAV